MKALIIDDSDLARQELRYLLRRFDNIKIIGEAVNAEDAKTKIDSLLPELIFLDIQMPDKDGFSVLEELEIIPEVIFTTAYHEYALKAYEHNALDYLLKPISEERLATAINKAEERINLRKRKNKALGVQDRVFVKDGENCWFINLSEIRVFEIVGNYTRIFFLDKKPMIPKSLNYIISRLDASLFFRANRTQIINVNYIDRIEPWFSNTLKAHLNDGQEILFSRRQSILFKKTMSF